MSRTIQSAILSVIGAVTLTACFTGVFTNFVKPSLRWYLVAAAVVLLAMGAYGVLTARAHADEEEAQAEHDHGDASGHGHDHSRGPLVGWFLLIPFLLLGFVVPPPLGSFAAQRDSGQVRGADKSFVETPSDLPEGKVTEMALDEYSMRALYDESESLKDRSIRLIGFASPDSQAEGGWALTRMKLSCCAADAYSIKINPVGAKPVPNNTWVAITGVWEKTPGDPNAADFQLPRIKVSSIEQIPQPENPYEG